MTHHKNNPYQETISAHSDRLDSVGEPDIVNLKQTREESAHHQGNSTKSEPSSKKKSKFFTNKRGHQFLLASLAYSKLRRH